MLNVIEGNRTRFPHLDDAEVASRKTFVLTSRRKTLSMREDLSTHAPKSGRSPSKRAGREERQGLLANEGGGGGGTPAGGGSAAAASPASAGSGGGGTREMAAARDDAAAAAQHGSNASYLDSGLQMQSQQMEEQEEVLGSLSQAVGRIKSIGLEMNDELSTQRRMLDDLEGQVDHASDAMSTLKAKMKVMSQSKDRGKYCAICVLSVLLFGLTSLVLST